MITTSLKAEKKRIISLLYHQGLIMQWASLAQGPTIKQDKPSLPPPSGFAHLNRTDIKGNLHAKNESHTSIYC